MALSFEQFKELRQKGLSDDQINNFDEGNIPQEKEGGFLSNVGNALKERGSNIMAEIKPPENIGQGIAQSVFKTKGVNIAGQAIAGVGDVVGEGIKSLAKTIVPEDTQQTIKESVVDVLQTPAGIAGLNALKAGADVYKKFEEANPETAKYLGNVLNIASIIPMEKGASLAGKEALNIAEDVGSLAMKTGISSKNTAKEALGQVLQGETKDIIPGQKALASLDLKGVSKFQELDTKMSDKISQLVKEVDADLGQDPTVKKLTDLATEIKTQSGKLVKTNYVATSLAHLKEFYQKIGDVAKQADIEDLIAKAKNEGLSKLEINNIAREYGQEFGNKAFSKVGDPLTSVNAQLFENVRKGLKNVAREGIIGLEAKKKDLLISNLYNTQRLIRKNLEAVNKLSQKAEKMGLGRQALRGLMKGADVVTLGGFRAVRESLIQSNIGKKTMNFLDIEEALKKNLKIIEKAGDKLESGKFVPKSMTGKILTSRPGMNIQDTRTMTPEQLKKAGVDPLMNEAKGKSLEEFKDSLKLTKPGASNINLPVKEIGIENFGGKGVFQLPQTERNTKAIVSWENKIKNGERPVVLIGGNGFPRVVDGTHRLQAYKNLGFKKIPTAFEDDITDIWKKANKTSAKKALKKKVDKLEKIIQNMDGEDRVNIEKFVDYVRLKKPENVDLEYNIRRMAEEMGFNPNIKNSALANKLEIILNRLRKM